MIGVDVLAVGVVLAASIDGLSADIERVSIAVLDLTLRETLSIKLKCVHFISLVIQFGHIKVPLLQQY